MRSLLENNPLNINFILYS